MCSGMAGLLFSLGDAEAAARGCWCRRSVRSLGGGSGSTKDESSLQSQELACISKAARQRGRGHPRTTGSEVPSPIGTCSDARRGRRSKAMAGGTAGADSRHHHQHRFIDVWRREGKQASNASKVGIPEGHGRAPAVLTACSIPRRPPHFALQLPVQSTFTRKKREREGMGMRDRRTVSLGEGGHGIVV